MRRLLPTLLCSVLLLALPTAAAEARGCRGADARPGTVSADRQARAVRCLLNQYRSAHGVRRLRDDRRLRRAARGHARDMVRGGFFGHTGSRGTTVVERIARTGYRRSARRWSAAETIAYGARRRGTARALVRTWLRSPGHRRIVLSRRWRDVGVAVVTRGRRATLAAAFGRRG